MASAQHDASAAKQRQWFIVGRWQQFEGEYRANVLRIIGIGAFYLIELANYHGLKLGAFELPPVAGVDEPFHQAVTALAVAWAMVALGTILCLRGGVFPASLKFATTATDVVLLTAILTVADGPRSPLVVGYFLIVVLSTIRFDLALVRFAAAASIGGYLFLLGYAKWFSDRDLNVPRYHQVISVLALVLCGVVLGQAVRRVRRLADEYAERLQRAGGGTR